MAVDRLEVLKNLLRANPGDQFARFGLAMEYAQTGSLDEAAAAFRELLGVNADYWGAYYHLGQVLERQGKIEDARGIYRQGVEVTGRLGHKHGRGELEAALEILG